MGLASYRSGLWGKPPGGELLADNGLFFRLVIIAILAVASSWAPRPGTVLEGGGEGLKTIYISGLTLIQRLLRLSAELAHIVTHVFNTLHIALVARV